MIEIHGMKKNTYACTYVCNIQCPGMVGKPTFLTTLVLFQVVCYCRTMYVCNVCMHACVYISSSRVKLPSKVCAPTKGVKRTNRRLRVASLCTHVCMYVCTSRPNLGHSASGRTKNKGKDWEEPLLRSSSFGLCM